MTKSESPSRETPDRERLTITLPAWLRNDATLYGAKRGYGMSELIARLLEKFVDEEKARLAEAKAMGAKARSNL